MGLRTLTPPLPHQHSNRAFLVLSHQPQFTKETVDCRFHSYHTPPTLTQDFIGTVTLTPVYQRTGTVAFTAPTPLCPTNTHTGLSQQTPRSSWGSPSPPAGWRWARREAVPTPSSSSAWVAWAWRWHLACQTAPSAPAGRGWRGPSLRTRTPWCSAHRQSPSRWRARW